jgi:2-methylisocitrate lyase-like PEP mutase family enzyme
MNKLKTILDEKKLLLAPGVYDALSALIAEQCGARAVYLSGAGVAYTRFGRSDLGLVDMTEMAQIIAAIRERVSAPIIADGDNGFGNALNMQRTVRTYERAGANAIQIEDQTLPKRCGHLTGKSVIPAAEMAGKIKAAVDARNEMLIIARTDAIAIEGFDKALERAHLYADAGADVIFVEALQDIEQMRAVVKSLGHRKPLFVNLIEGGRTPVLPLAELEAMGYSIAIYPASGVRAVAKHLTDFYTILVRDGGTDAFRDRMLDFNGLNGLIGTPELLAHADTYKAENFEKSRVQSTAA